MNRETVSDMPWWCKTGNPVTTVLSVQNKIFQREPEELNEEPGADIEAESHLHWQFFGIWKSCEELSWNHYSSTRHRSETNGIAEKSSAQRKKVGTSAVLLQSGVNEYWWADSMECYCYLRNVQDKLCDGKTQCERLFGMLFNGPATPFGAMVENHPIFAKDLLRLHQFCLKVLPGISLGYVLHAGESGKETLWSQTLKNWSEWTHLKSTSEGSMQSKGGVNADEKWQLLISSRRWNSQNLWGERHLRTSTLTRDRPERGEEQEFLHRNSHEWYTPSHLRRLSPWWWRDEKWLTGELIYRHHVVPWIKLYMPKEESFRIPTKYIDVTRTTHTPFDVMMEQHIEDNCRIDGEKELSDAWTVFIRFILLNQRPPDGYTWSGGRLTRKQNTSRPDDVWPDMWTRMSDAVKKKAKQRLAIEKSKLDNVRQLRGIYFIEPNDEQFKLIIKAARRKLEVPMPTAMPCKIPIKSSGETHRNIGSAGQDLLVLLMTTRARDQR